MASYKYSTVGIVGTGITIPNTIDAFSATLDTFTFDGATLGLSAADITNLSSSTGSLKFTINGTDITFTNFTSDKIDASKFIFADGSKILVGDGTATTTADAGDNTLFSTDYDDYIDGLGHGSKGNTVSYKNAGAAVTVDLSTSAQVTGGAGNDKLFNIDNVTGSNFNDNLKGSDAGNIIDGGIGFDTMDGGNGNDTYVVTPGDTVNDTGTTTSDADVIQSAYDYSLANATGVETLQLTGSTAVMAIGNSAANIIIGNGIGNILDGGGNADTLKGGGGNDTYLIDNTNDSIQGETAAGGIDWVVSTATTYQLDDVSGSFGNVENLRVISAAGVGGTGIGSSLANTILGGRGNDTLNGGAGSDTVTDLLGGNDTLIGGAGVDTLNGGKGNDTLAGDVSATNDATATTADNAVDTLNGGAGDDTYYVNETKDVVKEELGAGDDLVIASLATGTYLISANIETLTLGGTNAINGSNANGLSVATINGNTNDNTLTAGTKGDTLNGDGGNDTLVGGAGADALDGGAGNDKLSGGASVDTLNGGDGNDLLDGGAGVDSYDGGDGDDTYVVDNTSERNTKISDSNGTDTVFTNIVTATLQTYILDSEIENLVLGNYVAGSLAVSTSTSLLNGTGNNAANKIYGNAVDNTLTGGAGADELYGGLGNDKLVSGTSLTATDTDADTLVGGAGNDIYYVGGNEDILTETSTGGIDTVITGALATNALYTLNDFFEVLTLGGSNAIDGTHISSATTKATLNGNSNDNVLTAAGLGDTLNGLNGNDQLKGGAGADILNGGNNDDLLDGGASNDIMTGGNGADSYVIDANTDTVTETNITASLAETDVVFANITNASPTTAITYILTANVENLVLGSDETGSVGTPASSTDLLNGTGNASINSIAGNAAANTLTGGSGADKLFGGDGNDTLIGGINTTTADGASDEMTGGKGKDTYYVTDTSDVVTETFASTNVSESDTVNVNITTANSTFALTTENVEVLTLGGSAAINGSNLVTATTDITINGNAAANTLTGGKGNDTLLGNAGNDILVGNDGTDTLKGGAGKDTMTGGAGVDTFVFSAATDSGATSTTADVITDFSTATTDDIIDLSALGTFSLLDVGVAHSNLGDFELVRSIINSGADTLITGFVNADNTADFAIVLTGVAAADLNASANFHFA